MSNSRVAKHFFFFNKNIRKQRLNVYPGKKDKQSFSLRNTDSPSMHSKLGLDWISGGDSGHNLYSAV